MAENKNQITKIKDIASRYAEELEKRGLKPSSIILYGSFAKGLNKPWSDIDFIVISQEFSKMKPLKKLEFLSLATRDIDAPIEAIGYTPAEISKKGKNSVFWSEIKRSNKIVYERK